MKYPNHIQRMGIVLLLGATIALLKNGLGLSWFGLTSVCLGYLVGLGMLMNWRWTQIPALLLFVLWLFTSCLLIFNGKINIAICAFLGAGLYGLTTLYLWWKAIPTVEALTKRDI
ncbi:hypothetical protein [Cerasicoccus frondis]|uniref:hypothetical protein n=1 Tax=Cerasicoccus frondis TaxID=490090 RepID=UPI002852B778|nr:hypothetical protein [Cerasicoccus frondis]